MSKTATPNRKRAAPPLSTHKPPGRIRWAPVSSNSPFIEETRAFWEPLYGHPLSREDAREIIENVSGFLAMAIKWDREDQSGRDEASEREARQMNGGIGR